MQQQDRDEAILWARDMIANKALILDTETTGWPRDGGECCQIAIITLDGETVLSTLVKPSVPIDETGGAFAVHGIGNAAVDSAPGFADIHAEIYSILYDTQIVIFNKAFDVPILDNSAKASGQVPLSNTGRYRCAMLAYGAFEGSPDKFGTPGKYKWWKLTDACAHEGLEVREDAHDALADCLMTAALVKYMALQNTEEELTAMQRRPSIGDMAQESLQW